MCIGNYHVCNNFQPVSGSSRKLCFNPTEPRSFHPTEPCWSSKNRFNNHSRNYVPDGWEYDNYGLCDDKQREFGEPEPEFFKFYGTPRPTGRLCHDCQAEADAAASKKNGGVKKEEDEDGDQNGGWGESAAAPSGIALK